MEFWKELFSFGLTVILFGLAFGGFHPISTAFPAVAPSTAIACGIGLALSALSILKLRFIPKVQPKGVGFALLLMVLSDIPARRDTMFQGFDPHMTLLGLGAASLLLQRLIGDRFFPFIAVLAPIIGWVSFSAHADGRLLFSDDHGPFLYRLTQLRENFPWIPYYNPEWNGGVDAREFFPSGILNLFFIFAPVLSLAAPESIYNEMVLFVLLILLPASVFFAIRILESDTKSAFIGSVIAIFPTVYWFRWVISYGAMGFATSLALFPLALALSIRFIDDSEWKLRDTALFVVISFLYLLWPLAVLLLFPVGIIAILRLGKILKSKAKITALAALFILLTPWAAIFLSASPVGGFISRSSGIDLQNEESLPAKDIPADLRYKARSQFPTVGKTLGNFREHASRAHPLLLLAIPGFFLLKRRRLLAITCFWLVGVGFIGGPLLPHLELDRFLVALAILLVIPAALGVRSLLPDRINIKSIALAFPALALISFTPLALRATLTGHTNEAPYFADRDVFGLSAKLREFSRGGRAIFTGFTLHELSSGHVAPLADFSGVPLIARSYQHDTWKYVETVPLEYRSQGEPGIEEYFNLMNVTLVLADEPQWRKWFDARPERYKEVWRGGGSFRLYTRSVPSSYLLEGDGELISQDSNSMTFRIRTASAVIKARYFSFLQSSNCKISGEPKLGDLVLVRLTNCSPDEEVTISSVSPFGRLMLR